MFMCTWQVIASFFRYYFAQDAKCAKCSVRCMLQLGEDWEPSSSGGGVVSYTDGSRRWRTDFICPRRVRRTQLLALLSWRVTWHNTIKRYHILISMQNIYSYNENSFSKTDRLKNVRLNFSNLHLIKFKVREIAITREKILLLEMIFRKIEWW